LISDFDFHEGFSHSAMKKTYCSWSQSLKLGDLGVVSSFPWYRAGKLCASPVVKCRLEGEKTRQTYRFGELSFPSDIEVCGGMEFLDGEAGFGGVACQAGLNGGSNFGQVGKIEQEEGQSL
jgi:hypothetical protein